MFWTHLSLTGVLPAPSDGREEGLGAMPQVGQHTGLLRRGVHGDEQEEEERVLIVLRSI